MKYIPCKGFEALKSFLPIWIGGMINYYLKLAIPLRSYEVTKIQSYEVTKIQSYEVTKIQSYEVTKIQSYEVTKDIELHLSNDCADMRIFNASRDEKTEEYLREVLLYLFVPIYCSFHLQSSLLRRCIFTV